MTKKTRRRNSWRLTKRQRALLLALVFITILILLGVGYYILQDIGIIGGHSNPVGTGTESTQPPDGLSLGLPPTWTPTVFSISDIDFTKWALQLSDLPTSFENEPIDDIDAPFDLLAEFNDVTTVKQFVFSKEDDSPQLISGQTLLIQNPNSQAVFDERASTPEFIVDTILSTLNPISILEQEAIDGLEGIGDFSFGQSYVLDMEAIEMRVDIIIFRRGSAGAILSTLYVDGYSVDVSIQDLARILDQRIIPALTDNP